MCYFKGKNNKLDFFILCFGIRGVCFFKLPLFFYELKEYYLFPMDRKGLLTDLMDKSRLEQMAKAFGIRTPETISTDDDDIYNKVTNEIGYPLIVKLLWISIEKKHFLWKTRENLKEFWI